jgi:hypothetical protein
MISCKNKIPKEVTTQRFKEKRTQDRSCNTKRTRNNIFPESRERGLHRIK